MTILYFTATGNCLYVAKEMGGKLVSIPQSVKQKMYEFSDDMIGIIVPVYGLCIPPYIGEFIHKARFHCEYRFAILTYGFYAGAAVTQLIREAEKNQIYFDYIRTIKMVENYLPSFDMKKEKEKEKKDKIKDEIAQMLTDINGKKKSIKKDSFVDRWMTKSHEKNYAYKTGIGFTKEYIVSDRCNGCGICKQVCPMDNICLQNKNTGGQKPVYGQECISCFACIQNCPQKAIQLKKEKGTQRYRNSDINLREIMEAND